MLRLAKIMAIHRYPGACLHMFRTPLDKDRLKVNAEFLVKKKMAGGKIVRDKVGRAFMTFTMSSRFLENRRITSYHGHTQRERGLSQSMAPLPGIISGSLEIERAGENVHRAYILKSMDSRV